MLQAVFNDRRKSDSEVEILVLSRILNTNISVLSYNVPLSKVTKEQVPIGP